MSSSVPFAGSPDRLKTQPAGQARRPTGRLLPAECRLVARCCATPAAAEVADVLLVAGEGVLLLLGAICIEEQEPAGHIGTGVEVVRHGVALDDPGGTECELDAVLGDVV